MTADPPTIRIVCDGPSHARGKVATIATFTHDEQTGWQEPRTRELGTIATRRGDSHIQPFATQVIIGGRAYDPANMPQGASMRPGAYPIRYRLHCPLCGLDLQVTDTNWLPRLDQLTAAGVTQVTLPQLVTTIRSSTT